MKELLSRRYISYAMFIVVPLVFTFIIILTSYTNHNSWWIELLSFFVPFILLGVFMLLLGWLLIRPGWRFLWLPLLALAVSVEPLNATLALNPSRAITGDEVRVMSFNAALFSPYRPSTLQSDPGVFNSFYTYLRNNEPPDILCIQEFFHSVREDRELTADSIRSLGSYSHFYTNPLHNKKYDGLIGVITFSKYTILNSGKLDIGHFQTNNGHWIDIVSGSDTIRVFNVQLRSMSIRLTRRPGHTLIADIAYNVREIYGRLKMGYYLRQQEMELIEKALNASPYPRVICADLNALPYSQTYQRLKRKYHNAFERRGSGFGFTYHQFPWFIRIDNQFFDPDLKVSYFKTLDHIHVSDHYPVEAGYLLE